MPHITVTQLDQAGHYAGTTQAFASPLEPGQYLMPAGCISAAPPATWPDAMWPRWNGRDWDLIAIPASAQASAQASASPAI